MHLAQNQTPTIPKKVEIPWLPIIGIVSNVAMIYDNALNIPIPKPIRIAVMIAGTLAIAIGVGEMFTREKQP